MSEAIELYAATPVMPMTTKHRVLMVAPGNKKNGVPAPSSFVKRQAESLQQAGWKVVMTIVDDRTSFSGILRNFLRIQQEVIQLKPAVIHAQYGSVTAAIACWIKGRLPLIVSFCGDDLLGTPIPGLLWRIRETGGKALGVAAACGAAVIIVKSRNLLDALPVRLRRKALVLPNGVDTRWFQPLNADEARAKLGLPRDAKIILFHPGAHGNEAVKNPVLARASLEILVRSVPHVTLQQMSGVNQETVRLMLNAADCLLVTSFHEGSPNIVKEAMACNLPVVSVPCGDVVERLNGTYPGKICPYDADALAEAMKEVLRVACRSNGREQLIAQGLSAASVAERLVRIYSAVQKGRSIAAGSNKPACVG